MLKSNYYIFLLLLFFWSCVNAEKSEEIVQKTEASDTKLDSIQIDSPTLDTLAYDTTLVPIIFDFPTNIDSLFMDGLDENNENYLTANEVRNMSENYINYNGELEYSYVINNFIKIDSLKSIGEYDNYLSELDLGMTKTSVANKLGMFIINRDDYIQIWSISYSTYEACPFYSGTYVYATYFNNPFPRNTILVGELSGGGDAPYWVDVITTSTIYSDKAVVDLVEKSGGDEDENGNEIIDTKTETYTYKISENGFEPQK